MVMTAEKQVDSIPVEVVPKNYNFLCGTKKRVNLLWGSAGSGKSWSIAQFLIFEKMLKERNIRILVTRKTGPALKKSAWLLVHDLLEKYEIEYVDNKQDMVIYIGSSEMYFVALDDPEKLKSLEKINYVWNEESTEISKKEFLQLNIRCRGENLDGKNTLYFSFNPIEKLGVEYLKERTENPPDTTACCHSTVEDNPFADPEYIEVLDELAEDDVAYHTIYRKGQWASPKNIIYTNWHVTGKWPLNLLGVGYGLDFGFNRPTALTEIGFKDTPGQNRLDVYIREILYETNLTNNQLIEQMKLVIPQEHMHRAIIADSAEPERIGDIKDAGFNVFPCSKTKSSVKSGILKVKSHRCFVHRESTNIIKEQGTYKWKEDMWGNPLDAPVEYNNHAMDSIRYYVAEIETEEAAIYIVGNVMG